MKKRVPKKMQRRNTSRQERVKFHRRRIRRIRRQHLEHFTHHPDK